MVARKPKVKDPITTVGSISLSSDDTILVIIDQVGSYWVYEKE